MNHLQRIALSTFLLFAFAEVQSQVFIPTSQERDWLNTEIPGIVDASGIMDTLHPGIQSLDSSLFLLYTLPANLEFRGIEYLDSLNWLTIATYGQMVPPTEESTIIVAELPDSLVNFHVAIQNSNGSNIFLPQLPEGLDMLWIEDVWTFTRVVIAGFPEQMGLVQFDAIDSLSWSGTCPSTYVNLRYSDSGNQGIRSIPPVSCENFIVDNMQFSFMDLSAVETSTLSINSCTLTGTLIWPTQVETLHMSSLNVYGTLPPFPSMVTEIQLEAFWIPCLPLFPEGLTSLYMYQGVSCLPNWPSTLPFAFIGVEGIDESNAVFCSVLNSACPGSYPGISGRVFVDLNANDTYDSNEGGLPQAQVTVQPGGHSVGCAPDGMWEIGVMPGNYTVDLSTSYPYIQSFSPIQHTADVPNLGDADTLNDFAVQLIPNIADLRAWLWAEPARPGFDNRLYLTCQNYGTIPLDAELTLNYDGDQTWVGSSIAPASSTATSATWTFPAMAIGASATVTVDLNTATSVALGTPIEHLLAASSAQTDETPNDNTYLYSDSVVGSFDPNDKLLNPSVLSPAQVQAGETPIEYTIRFQNTGTYLAERVVILDTLSTELQWESIRFLDSSHPNRWYVVDGVLHVIHNDINLPDSTSDEANSHGFVRFSMLPSTDLADGETITNIAHIVFDFNAPIITPPAVFSVDVTASVTDLESSSFSIYPNPVRDRLWITIPDAQKTINYRISDMLGKVVLNGASANGVDVQALAPGLYTLMLDQAGVRESVRFVKD